MLIVCPNCSSSYLIRATEIGSEGRVVRCGSCQNSWHVSGMEAGGAETLGDSAQQPEKTEKNVDFANAHLARRTLRPSRRLAVGGLAMAAIAAIFVMPLGKIAEVARALIGKVLPADQFAGIDFENVSSQLVAENEQIFLVVEGLIVAKSGEPRAVPGLALTIRGEANDQIFRWTVKPPAETIAVGAPIPFKVRLASPPVTGREVLIRFVDASEVGDVSAS